MKGLAEMAVHSSSSLERVIIARVGLIGTSEKIYSSDKLTIVDGRRTTMTLRIFVRSAIFYMTWSKRERKAG
jgi:hypothetical protein